MQNRFIRIGEQVIAINHIVSVYRHSNGDVSVDMVGDDHETRLYASTGEAQAFWSWQTSAINTTTLHVQQQESSEPVVL